MPRLKRFVSCFLAALFTITSFTLFINFDDFKKDVSAATNTPLSVHGRLSVSGTDIVDKNGNKFQLRGVSTHGLAWDGNKYSGIGGSYVNANTFTSLRDDWGANAVRLALYVSESGGYCTDGNKTTLDNKVQTGVNTARDCGMYAIIDWHILNTNPNNYLDAAKTFWANTSLKYKDYDNVIYEICNEPNNCSWDDIKKYANTIIPIIRKNDPKAIIIVGTPTYSQLGAQGHTNEVADSPLTGYTNIMYSLHFYCAESVHTQYLPAKVDYAMKKKLPIIVSEFGLSEASGDGKISTTQADVWLKKLDGYNISYFCWALSKKSESCSLFKTSTTYNWKDSDLTPAGIYIRNAYRARKENFSNTTPTPKPTATPTPTPKPTPVPVFVPQIDATDRGYAEAFVERLYVNMMGRPSDKQGMDNWVYQMSSDRMSGTDVAKFFYSSPEFTKISAGLTNQQYVTRMYNTILGREPDTAGFNNWVNALDAKTLTREQIFTQFLQSAEWKGICSVNEILSGHYQLGKFIDRLYLVVLNRQSDKAGRDNWINAYANGFSARTLAQSFIFSDEFKGKKTNNTIYITVLYKSILGREPDAGGLNTWVNELNRGVSRESVFESFIKSDEFTILAASYNLRVN